MNVYDSERMALMLAPLGYVQTACQDTADVILVNTCAIRAKAEQKLFSYLGRLSEEKKRRPSLTIGVGGCVAQQEGKNIIKRAPCVDLVFGTDAVHRLPELLSRAVEKKQRLVDVRMENSPFSAHEVRGVQDSETGVPVSRFISIMQGCDNFCTYCVVPYVRGRERSREPESIVNEIRDLVSIGTREVTLLGQNVNSYGKKEHNLSFSDLLRRMDKVEGLGRIRFTTSHPKDLSPELIECFSNVQKLCRHIHLPVQSGSDDILNRMNRKYSVSQYLEKVDALRKQSEDIAITSDIIVGFPGETDAQFNGTLELIQRVRFDGLFAFMYSDRPNAAAARFPDKIPEKVKADRLSQVLDLQQNITLAKNRELENSIQTVLVEGESKRPMDPSMTEQWSGRTECNRIVNFTRPDHHLKGESGQKSGKESLETSPLIGKMVSVYIEKGHAHSLSGRSVEAQSMGPFMKGETGNVA